MANECDGNPGSVAPIEVDRNRCEAEQKCVEVCPYNVFKMRDLAPEERSELSLLGRVKAWAHGNRQAFVVRPASCQAHCPVVHQGLPRAGAAGSAAYRG